jgi:hypothetical protein
VSAGGLQGLRFYSNAVRDTLLDKSEGCQERGFRAVKESVERGKTPDSALEFGSASPEE